MFEIGDHPDIESALRTGYPVGSQPESYHCEACGECLDDEDIYEDEKHDYICQDCLLRLHTKSWW